MSIVVSQPIDDLQSDSFSKVHLICSFHRLIAFLSPSEKHQSNNNNLSKTQERTVSKIAHALPFCVGPPHGRGSVVQDRFPIENHTEGRRHTERTM
jgi:hypothetical protein